MKRSLRRALVLGALVLTSPLWGNALAAGAELLAYGSLYAEGRPTRLYEGGHGMHSGLRPGASAPGLVHSVRVNQHGLRGPEVLDPKPEDSLRVFVLGGSSSFDVYARDNDATWPQKLQGALQARSEAQVEVLNGGLPGEVLGGSLLTLVELDPALQPDVVLIFHGPNDIRHVLTQSQLSAPSDGVCDQDILPPMDVALLRWRERLFPVKPDPSTWRDAPMGAQGRAHLRRQLEQAMQVVDALGARAVLVTHPLQTPHDADGSLVTAPLEEYAGHLFVTPERIAEAFGVWNEVVQEVADRARAPVIDLATDFPDEDRYWGDASHFAAAGSELAAERIAEGMAEAGLDRAGLRGPARGRMPNLGPSGPGAPANPPPAGPPR